MIRRSTTHQHTFRQLRESRPSDALVEVAASAYDLIAEMQNPAPDHVMRERARANLSAAVKGLSYDERVWLAAVAGR